MGWLFLTLRARRYEFVDDLVCWRQLSHSNNTKKPLLMMTTHRRSGYLCHLTTPPLYITLSFNLVLVPKYQMYWQHLILNCHETFVWLCGHIFIVPANCLHITTCNKTLGIFRINALLTGFIDCTLSIKPNFNSPSFNFNARQFLCTFQVSVSPSKFLTAISAITLA